jgi:hypothetical protein
MGGEEHNAPWEVTGFEKETAGSIPGRWIDSRLFHVNHFAGEKRPICFT